MIVEISLEPASSEKSAVNSATTRFSRASRSAKVNSNIVVPPFPIPALAGACIWIIGENRRKRKRIVKAKFGRAPQCDPDQNSAWLKAGIKTMKGGEKMLGRSYGMPEQTEKARQLAEKVTSLIVTSDVTYKEVHNALELVLETLETKTKPILIKAPVQDDSESNP